MCKQSQPEIELRTRLVEFNKLVEEFQEVVAIVPYESKLTFGAEAVDSEMVDHKARLLRLALLRKFVQNSSDWCYLPALLQDAADYFAARRPEVADEARVGLDEFEKRSRASLVRMQRQDRPHKSAPETVFQLMYGSLLHADYGKRQDVDPMSLEARVMLMTWLPDMEAIVRTAGRTFLRWAENDALWGD